MILASDPSPCDELVAIKQLIFISSGSDNVAKSYRGGRTDGRTDGRTKLS